MFCVHRWSFLPNETFDQVQRHYWNKLTSDFPDGTQCVHFCCDTYDCQPSLKSLEREAQSCRKPTKLFDVDGSVVTPAFRDFIIADHNKAALLRFLVDSWSRMAAYSTGLFLSGGFADPKKCVHVDQSSAKSVPELTSTHLEADLRMMLHVVYSAQKPGINRIVVHANDTDVLVLCGNYTSKYRQIIRELWIKCDSNAYIPVHDS